MHEIDKAVFSAFLSQLRKEKGLTQKDLAEKLYISDKAVSKWERGLSMPDISLLLPLSETLGVTVTELLEGRKLKDEEITTEQAEVLLQKALRLEGARPSLEDIGRRLVIFTVAVLTAFFEIAAANWWMQYETIGSSYITFEALSFFFGIYFWFFLPERLPGYYDENKISAFSDSFLRLNLPGVAFNNSNWPRIVKAFRLWSILSVVIVPLAGICVSLLNVSGEAAFGIMMVSLLAYLGSLFVPVYCAAKDTARPTGKRRTVYLMILLALILAVLWLSGQSFDSGVKVGYMESSTLRRWSASYVHLDGMQHRNLYPKESDYVLAVVTKAGSLSITLKDEDGTVFSQEDIQTGTYPVTLDGKTELTIRSNGHRGSFSIEPKE